VPSLADAMRMLREQAQRTPPNQWVHVIEGWSEFQFAEKRMPTLDELNAAAPETPVFVLHLYASAMLNRAALRAVGYTSQRPEASVRAAAQLDPAVHARIEPARRHQRDRRRWRFSVLRAGLCLRLRSDLRNPATFATVARLRRTPFRSFGTCQ